MGLTENQATPCWRGTIWRTCIGYWSARPRTRSIGAVGWADYTNLDVADDALAHSLYHVVALHEEAVIGMARVVGDGAMFFYIQDVVVAPAHRGRGVGTLLLERVMGYLEGAAPKRAFIGLFAAAGTPPYYARFGFAVRMGLTGLFRTAPA